MALYAMTYWQTLQTREHATGIYYTAFMFVFCLSFFLALGFVGLFASLTWNLRLYARVKMERGAYELLDGTASASATLSSSHVVGLRPIVEKVARESEKALRCEYNGGRVSNA